jgi:putative membrane protein
MAAVAVVFGLMAGALHVGFWLMEAVWWRQPRIWKRFGARSQEDADTMAFGMLNQGYYNLFLGLGAIVGAILVVADIEGRAILLGYSCLFMMGAAVVLVVARRSMLRAAAIQGAPPAIALLALALT